MLTAVEDRIFAWACRKGPSSSEGLAWQDSPPHGHHDPLTQSDNQTASGANAQAGTVGANPGHSPATSYPEIPAWLPKAKQLELQAARSTASALLPVSSDLSSTTVNALAWPVSSVKLQASGLPPPLPPPLTGPLHLKSALPAMTKRQLKFDMSRVSTSQFSAISAMDNSATSGLQEIQCQSPPANDSSGASLQVEGLKSNYPGPTSTSTQAPASCTATPTVAGQLEEANDVLVSMSGSQAVTAMEPQPIATTLFTLAPEAVGDVDHCDLDAYDSLPPLPLLTRLDVV